MSETIVTANRLSDGAVVYLADEGRWSEVIACARVATAESEVETLLAVAAAMPTQVVGPYAIAVATDGGPVRPLHIKEAIRAGGPTVRPDLGKQAALACAAE